MIHHQYIYHIYDIYEESQWKSSQDLSAEELSGEDVGGRVSWVPTAAHANSAVLVATSPSRDRTDVFRVHWSIKMFSEKFADDSPGGFSSKWCRKMANITGDLETNIRYLYIFLSLVQRTIGNHRNFMQIVPTISPIQSGGWEHQLPAMCCREL